MTGMAKKKALYIVILLLITTSIVLLVARASPSSASQDPVPIETAAAEETATETITLEETEVTLTEEPALTLLGDFKTTAYCTCVKCCGIWSSEHPSRIGTGYVQKTASGTIPTEGRTISVDPDVIPLGTTVVIDDHEYIAEDTGSAVVGNVVDIYFSSHEAARQYGVQTKTIYVKGE